MHYLDKDLKKSNLHAKNKSFLWALFIVFICLISFGSSLNHELTQWDDNSHLNHNNKMQEFSLHSLKRIWTEMHYEMYVPVTYTIWFLIAGVNGWVKYGLGTVDFSPMPFRAVSLAFHLLNCLLLFYLIKTFIKRFLNTDFEQKKENLISFLGTAFFAIHPIQIEAICWTSELRDLVSVFFALVFLHLIFSKKILLYRCQFLAIIVFLIGMLAKPGIATLPIVALIILHFLEPKHKPYWTIPLFIISFLSFILAKLHIGESDMIYNPPLYARPLVTLDSIRHYIFQLFWPYPLIPEHGRRYADIVSNYLLLKSTLSFLFLFALGFLLKKINWHSFLFYLFFIITISPVAGLFPFKFQQLSTTADHYLYFPMIFIALLIVSIFTNTKKQIQYFIFPLFFCYIIYNFNHIKIWQNTQTLTEYSLKFNPQSHALHSIKGHDYFSKNLFTNAINEYELAITYEKNLPETLNNLAISYFLIKEVNKSINTFETLISLGSAKEKMKVNYADILISVGENQKAILVLQEILKSNPMQAEAHFQLSQALVNLQQIPMAEFHKNKAFELDPNLKNINGNSTNKLWETPE